MHDVSFVAVRSWVGSLIDHIGMGEQSECSTDAIDPHAADTVLASSHCPAQKLDIHLQERRVLSLKQRNILCCWQWWKDPTCSVCSQQEPLWPSLHARGAQQYLKKKGQMELTAFF